MGSVYNVQSRIILKLEFDTHLAVKWKRKYILRCIRRWTKKKKRMWTTNSSHTLHQKVYLSGKRQTYQMNLRLPKGRDS